MRPGWIIAIVSTLLALAFAYISLHLPPQMEAYPTFLALAAFAYGWPSLIGIPSRRGGPLVIAFTGITAVVLVQLTHNFLWAAVVMGFAVIAAFIHQMAREGGRPGLVESVSGIVTGASIALAGIGWLAAMTTPVPPSYILVGGIALAAASLATALPGNWAVRSASSVCASIVAAGLSSYFYLEPALAQQVTVSLVLGAAIGSIVAFVRIAAWPALLNRSGGLSLHRAELAAYAVPLLSSGIVVYGVARLLEG